MADKTNFTSFSEAQKQYLSGVAMGADVARAVAGLPVLSNRHAKTAEVLKIGANSANGAAAGGATELSAGPECLALQAQAETEAAGGKLCKEEIAKRNKNPLDMWDEIHSRADAAEFPKGTDVFLMKQQGLFYVAPAQDAFMCRLRIPGGLLYSWQFSGLADLADRSAGGFVDCTTRGNLQLREIPADQAMEVLYGLRELDIVPLGSGADNIRNCTASALSGIDAAELIETIPLAKRMHHTILNHREMYGLPRKFNIAFDGGGRISALDDTNDIGFRAVEVSAEQADEALPEGVYFQLTLGGNTGHKDFARYTGVLLRPDECVAVAVAIVRVFIASGNRTDRKKARLKYVLDDWGFEKFLAAVEQQWGKPLRRVAEDRFRLPDNEDRLAHIGFHRQSQQGLWYVGLVLPVGRISSDQARGIAGIADRYGNAQVRATVWQNVVLPGIREVDIPAVQAAIKDLGLDYQASRFQAGLIACTGSAGCKFANAPTKSHATQIAASLQSAFDLEQPINIHVTGCHNSCAQHYIGDIGLQGCKVEQGDEMVDGYHVHLGGGWGKRQAVGRLLFEAVPWEDVLPLLHALIEGYLQEREGDESFVQFSARTTDEQWKQLAQSRAG